jgi:prepilin-type N-terminal cleavage/methylation domain-containing protein
MRLLPPHNSRRGMTLVELLVAVTIMTLVFGGIMLSLQYMLRIIGSSKAYAGGVALANEQMEYIRSLDYDAVGTAGGIPDGIIPQNGTTTLNGITYTYRVLVEYIDSPQDGEGEDDENGILADYKLAKVTYAWEEKGEPREATLISNIIPPGIETTDGGGTLKVNVFDAAVQPIAGASVHVYNDSGSSTIDTTRFTNSNGIALFSGAPALANYEITVSDSGYSTDQTYSPDAANPNPVTPPVAVLESQVSTMNFQIDRLSNLTVATVGLPTNDSFDDAFDDAANIASSTNTQVSAGALMLAGAPGSFAASGDARSIAVAPGVIAAWGSATFNADIPPATNVFVRVYDASGTLVPDADLPGNSAGFTSGTIDLSALDPASYPSLALGAALTSADAATSSALAEWSIGYTVSEPAIANVPFSITGAKVIGTSASGTPIYKYDDAFTTDGTGDVTISDLEWDSYDIAVTDPSYDIAEACENIPYALDPGVSETLKLTLAPAVANSLRVRVEDTSGVAIPNAEVTLSRPSFSETETSSTCGGAFFNSGVSSASDYDISVSATGYTPRTITAYTVSGATAITIPLSGA